MSKRIAIAILVFALGASVSAIPAAIVLAILDIYLSGNSIVNINTVPVFPGMELSGLLFGITVITSGVLGSALYWRLSKPE